MSTFDQFYDKLNGPMYQDIPPPVKYTFAAYMDKATGGVELTPLTDEDMGQAVQDDVAAQYFQLHGGKNPRRLGDQLTDGEFKRFMGQTW